LSAECGRPPHHDRAGAESADDPDCLCAESLQSGRHILDCAGLLIDVQVENAWTSANTSSPALTFDSQGKVTNTWQFNPGVAGDIVVLRVMYVRPVVLGPFGFNLSNLSNGNRLIMGSAAFQNAPSS